MAKRYIAGNLNCNNCKERAIGSMYIHNSQKVCRACALKVLEDQYDLREVSERNN